MLGGALGYAAVLLIAHRSRMQFVTARLRHLVKYDGDELVCIDKLAEQLADCYERAALPAESALPWARPAIPVELPVFLDRRAASRDGVSVKVHASAERLRPAARPN